MAIELVVEDGSIVEGANSYVTLEEARSYVETRGLTLPTEDDAAIPLVVAGTEYVDSFSRRYKGRPTSPAVQNLSFPRVGVTVDGYTYEDNVIPPGIKTLTLAAIAVGIDHDLIVNTSEPNISREAVGPLSTSYATSSIAPWSGPDFPLLENLMYPFIGSANALWASIPLKRI